MDPVIRSLTLQRFRSFIAERVEFANPTFLVGPNGSGKSNLVDAFAFMAEAMTSPLPAVIGRRGGLPAIINRVSLPAMGSKLGIAVALGALDGIESAHYAFEIEPLPHDDIRVAAERCRITTTSGKTWRFDRDENEQGSTLHRNVASFNPRVDPGSLLLPLIGGDLQFSPLVRALSSMRTYATEPAKIREMQDPDSGTSLKADGTNVASVLQEIGRRSEEDLALIFELLAVIVPHTTRVQPVRHGNKVTLEFIQQWGATDRLKLEAFNVSEGTLRALALLTAVFQHPTPVLIAIEEPEASMHPGALGAILDVLQMASRRMQVVVTTHSPEVLDAKWIEDRHLRMVTWQEGASRITPVAETSRKALEMHLMGAGELLRANALDAAERPQESGEPANLFERLPS